MIVIVITWKCLLRLLWRGSETVETPERAYHIRFRNRWAPAAGAPESKYGRGDGCYVMKEEPWHEK